MCLPTSAVLETGKIKKLLTYGHQYDTDAEDFEEDPVDVKLKVSRWMEDFVERLNAYMQGESCKLICCNTH